MTYDVIIVDDEPLARENVRLILQDIDIHHKAHSITECSNGHEAIHRILGASVPERLIVFLDIQMPEVSGFDVLEALKSAGMKVFPVIIFVTAFDHYALRAFEYSALDYLLKPIDDERFQATWNRVIQRIEERNAIQNVQRLMEFLEEHPLHTMPSENVETNVEKQHKEQTLERFILKERGRTVIVDIEKVIWIEAQDYYVQIHTPERAYLLRESLTHLEKILPHNFVRSHRSAIVNIRHIASINTHEYGDGEVVLKNSTRIKCSRTYRQHLLDFLKGS